MQIMGILSANAVAIPVITLVAPGPEVTAHTPGLPVIRATPLAAWAAFCSVRINTVLMSESRMLLKKGHMATPGYPKTVLTPSASRHLIIASAPIILLCSFIYTPLFLLFQTLLHQAFGQFHGIRRILGIAVGTDLIRIFLRNDSAADDDLGGDAFFFCGCHDLPHSLHGGGHQC